MFDTSPVAKDPPILTVSQLTQSIKLFLEKEFKFVCLQGEVSNCKVQSSGHIYFSLNDAEAQISAVMFRLDAAALLKKLKDGDKIIAKGAINVYPPSGKYQLVVREIQFTGLGELLLKLEELKLKIAKKGWFKPEHKKPLPKMPKKIGVVTSPTGAVISDIIHVLTRRFSGFELILNPVKVQGEGAACEIAAAIDAFNRYHLVDVIIVARGGGSLEDLWAFNEEIVAESIFNSQIPIISAVGHETDHSIADYVADIRAPTPSAAAEIVMAEKAGLLKTLSHQEKALKQGLSHRIKHLKEQLNGIKRLPEFQSPYFFLGPLIQKMDEVKASLDRQVFETLLKARLKLEGKIKQAHALKPTTHILHWRQKLQYFDKDLQKSIKKIFADNNNRIAHISHLLKSIDPKNLLSKGYSILFSEKSNSIINSIRAIEIGQDVRILLSDGKALSTIKEIIPNERAE